jgi:glycosyltransferase involved in cell wall biosynthesis
MHRTLRSIAGQTYPRERIEIIFMDASSDGRVGARAVELLPGTIVVPAAHLPYYEMKNAGAEHASGDLVAFIDSDVTWNSEWVSTAVRSLAELPPYSAVVGLTRYLPGWFSDVGTVSQFGYHWDMYASGDHDGLLGVIANNFALRRQDFLDVRYRHTDFRQGMDMVLASDLQARGGTVRLEPALRAMHTWSSSKIREHPQTAYNVGRGLTTAVRNCDWLLRTGRARSYLARTGVRLDLESLLNGSVPAVLTLVAARFWVFQGYLRRTRKVLGVPRYQLVPSTVFLAGFFAVIALGALSHRRPAPGDGRRPAADPPAGRPADPPEGTDPR